MGGYGGMFILTILGIAAILCIVFFPVFPKLFDRGTKHFDLEKRENKEDYKGEN